MEWKMTLWKWHTFWMAPCLICFFNILLYIERKWFLMKNLAAILFLNSKLSGKKFSVAIGRSIEYSKNSIKMKSFEEICKAQTASHLEKII